eukprot:CAMPEP_0171338262 /NCGR_PEP_ID=MMETSP0878-20121228/7221_1 /TAXON_ID=67004 /ORGANISM="Thalassiosira weissflogii, Strain CCMP1336" /LENGTH=565 /DNA_ID=CAMNT_0011840027 /DNA_START=132 /DNA_END=1829 /DNA_ORIENTATION=+
MMSERKRLTRIFKMRGLSVQAPALNALMNVLRREKDHKSGDDVLFAIIDEIKDRMIQGGGSGGGGGGVNQFIVTTELLEQVVADLSRDESDVAEEAVQLLDAFKTPRLAYDAMRKQFNLERFGKEGRSICGEALDKVEMFAQRYALIQQRILRQDIFQPKLITATNSRRSCRGNDGGENITLTPVESLLGRSGRRFLLGMIVQVEEGKYYLEDHTGQVALNLSQATLLTDGFVTENCIVLVEGETIDGVLHVHNMGNPIVENRSNAIEAIGLQNTDIFHSIGSLSELQKLRQQELQHGQDGTFVILSDVHLDKPTVIENIDKMLDGYKDFDPLPIFVFMGNFTSKPLSGAADGTKAMMSYFEDLASVIGKYPRMAKEGRFVFVPGRNDPGITGVLPRGPIPKYFTSALRSRVKHALFTSNPCRIRYFTKEIVFFRDDLVSKLRRHSLLEPRDDDDDGVSGNGTPGDLKLSRHAIKTVLDQGHLSPLPLPASPIYWQWDHALRLYPFPDALVLGDRVGQFYENYEECDAVNPGAFSEGGHFVVYTPIAAVEDGEVTKSDVEFSQIE